MTLLKTILMFARVGRCKTQAPFFVVEQGLKEDALQRLMDPLMALAPGRQRSEVGSWRWVQSQGSCRQSVAGQAKCAEGEDEEDAEVEHEASRGSTLWRRSSSSSPPMRPERSSTPCCRATAGRGAAAGTRPGDGRRRQEDEDRHEQVAAGFQLPQQPHERHHGRDDGGEAEDLPQRELPGGDGSGLRSEWRSRYRARGNLDAANAGIAA